MKTRAVLLSIILGGVTLSVPTDSIVGRGQHYEIRL